MRFRPSRSQKTLLFLIGAVVLFIAGKHIIRLITTERVRVAMIAPLTGDHRAEAVASRNAIRLFIDQFNRMAEPEGYKVVLDVYDSSNDPEKAERIMKQVRASDAVAVVGPHSNEACLRTSRIEEGDPLPVVTPCGTDDRITATNEWYFRTMASESVETRFLATYALSILGITELNVISEDSPRFNPLSEIFERGVREKGGELRGNWTLDPGVESEAENSPSRAAIARIVSELKNGADNLPVVLLLPPEPAAEVVRQLRNAKLPNRVLGLSTLAESEFRHAFRGMNQENLKPGFYTEGCYLTAPYLMDNMNSEAFRVSNDYQEKFGSPMTGHSMFAYDSIKIICSALEDAKDQFGLGESVSELRESLRGIMLDYDSPEFAVKGVTGHNYFDENRNAQKDVAFGVYRGGEVATAFGQLHFLGDEASSRSQRELLEDGHTVVELDGRYYSRADIVYAGVNMLDIVEFNPDTLETKLRFYLWLRFRDDLNAADIVFNNAVGEVELGEPAEAFEKDGVSYRLFEIESSFKPDFLEEIRYGRPVLGLSFQHDRLPLSRLQYVIDTEGGAAAEHASQKMHQRRLNAWLESAHGWGIKEVSAFTGVEIRPALGHTLYLLQGKDHLEFSRFVFGMVVEKNRFSMRNSLGATSAEIVLGIVIVLLLTIAFEGKNRFLRTIPRALLIVQASAIIIGLVALEVVLLSLFDQRLHHYQIDGFVKAFDILWWLAVALIVNKVVSRFLWDPLEKVTGNIIPVLIRRFVTGTILLAAIFCIIAFVFGYKITSLLASSGVAAMILGLALQINLSNIVSGIALNMDRAFKIGDWLKVGGDIEGKVLNIGWRATRIQTWDKCELSIPNNVISESSIHNWSAPSDEYWLWPKVQIDPRHPPDVVKKILKDAVLAVKGVCKDPEPEIYCEIATWSVDYIFAFAVRDYKRRHDYQSAVWESVWEHLEAAGIDLGTESREVTTYQGEEKGSDKGETHEWDLLRDLEILESVSDEKLRKLLNESGRRDFAAGEAMIEGGNVPNAIFVIVEGVAEVTGDAKGKEFEVARLGPGTALGEISFLTDEEPIATVRALTPVMAIELNRENFGPLLRESTDLVEAIVRVIEQRKSSTEEHRDRALAHKEKKEAKESLFSRILKKFLG